MAHESFENEEVAATMNREFVNIKVDREERPDVDRVYMTFVQATTGGGGWPMSVWLTPDLQPFVGGTYFPPEDRYGQPGFKKVLERVAEAWKQNHEKITEQGAKIISALQEAQAATPDSSDQIDINILEKACEQFSGIFDAKEGGFGNAPKFPRPAAPNFLTRFYARDPKTDSGKRALEMDLVTLRKVAAGGMHDHLGGGFHRYSVDRYWHVPHFEKMLYDQAQLATAYLDAFQITNDPHLRPPLRFGAASNLLPLSHRERRTRGASEGKGVGEGEADAKRQVRDDFESVVRDNLDYVARDMTSKEGGFFSAEDADSLLENGKPEHAEGAFYVWTKKEVDAALGDAAEIFDFHYGVQPNGNAPEGSDPQGEFHGKNILIERHTIAETAKQFQKSEDEVRQSLARSREKLFSIRTKRPRPHLDDKIISAWNGLMISAYARGAQVLNSSRYLESAVRAAKFVRSQLWDEENKTLYRAYRGGRGTVEGFADDYAFVIQGMVDLYEASFDVAWLRFAIELQEVQDRLFFDEKIGGYFSTSGRDKSVVLRMKDDNDSAEPAASSVAALNLLRLAQFRDEKKLEERGKKTIGAFSATISRFPNAMPQMLVALDFSLSKPRQIVIAGKPNAPETKALLAEVHRHFLPNKILLLADGADGQKYLGEKNEALRSMSVLNGKPAAYVCENFTCKAPVTSPDDLRDLLATR